MKKLTRDRVVPTIFGQCFLTDFRDNRFRLAFFPEVRQQQQHPGQLNAKASFIVLGRQPACWWLTSGGVWLCL
jgi:hypothetical protein